MTLSNSDALSHFPDNGVRAVGLSTGITGKEYVMSNMPKPCTPIIRMTSHAGTPSPIAILSEPFFDGGHGELTARVYDFASEVQYTTTVYWINRHTFPARDTTHYAIGCADELSRLYPGCGRAVFDLGATEPMQSWMGARIPQ
jgi:hypothetical protein